MVNLIVSIGVVFAVIISFFPAEALCKPQPVTGIILMYDAFNKMEGEFRARKWSESKKSIRYIQSYYARLSQELKKTVDLQTINKLGFHVSRLNRIIETEDLEAVADSYMELQKLFLEIMGYYEYPNPPSLIIYARYIDEAREGLEAGDLTEVFEEMEEIMGLRDFGEISFKEKGVSASDIDKFFKKIEMVKKSTIENKITDAQKGLIELAEFVGKYIQK